MRLNCYSALQLTLITCCLLGEVTPVEGVLLTAHRGASYDAPENTLSAFNLAWERGADGIEGDFYLTSDGHVVCIHDATTTRTGDTNLTVAASTLAELRAVDVGSWKGEQWAGEKIPTLREVIATIPDGKYIHVELKSGLNIVEPMAKILEESSLTSDQIIIICFNQSVVAAAKNRLPHCRVLWLKAASNTSPSAAEVLDALRTSGADGVGLSANTVLINAGYVSTVRAGGGYEFNVWTVNDGSAAAQFAATGLDAITTDRPAYLRAFVEHSTEEGPPPIPVIHWSFDGVATNSGSGGSAKDAALHNGPVYTNGTVGSAALDLDGVDDYVSVEYTLADQGSVAMWFYPEPWYDYQSVFNNSIGPNDWEMWIDCNGWLKARVKSDNSGWVSYDLNTLNGSNHWYHIVFTWDKRIGATALFVNGTLRSSGTIGAWVDPGTTFFLGGSAGNSYCKGMYDDLRVYETKLNQADVQRLFGAVLAVYLPLDGTADDIAPGRYLPATLIGDYAYTNGVDGEALVLRDPGRRVCAQVDYTLPEQEGSISLWHYPTRQTVTYHSVYDNSVNDNDWEMWSETNSKLTARVRGNSGRVHCHFNDLNGWNNWYHLVYTWNRAEGMAKLFVNGLERSSDLIDEWASPGKYFYLGSGSGGNTNRNGRWDDLRIYNRAVTARDVYELFSEFRKEAVYLPLDGTAVDQAGETNSVTIHGDPRYVPGVHGLALDGNGVDAYVAIDHTWAEKGSFALWYYAQGAWYDYQSIIDNSVDADDWEMWIYNSGSLRFRIEALYGDVTCDLNKLNGPNHWYHIAVTWDRYGEVKLYIDGELRDFDEIEGRWVDPGSTVYLGGGHNNNTLGNGAWDEVYFCDYILEPYEIAKLATKPPSKGTTLMIQ